MRSEGLRLAETLQAMACVGISPSHQAQLLRLLAALLHLGNVQLRAQGDIGVTPTPQRKVDRATSYAP